MLNMANIREMDEMEVFRQQFDKPIEQYQDALLEVKNLRAAVDERTQYISNLTSKYEKLEAEHKELKEKMDKLNEMFGTAVKGGKNVRP